MAKSKHTVATVVEWLQAHELISIAKLERRCDIPQGSLSNALAGKMERLSDKHLPKLVVVLRDYGFK